ncbi:MAG: hypothetical protein RLZZ507_2121 [Cyanobacteriota bacterium]|jgi:hypothetical protein
MTLNFDKKREEGFTEVLLAPVKAIIGDPKELYGEYYVTDEIKQSAKITNSAIVISNNIDGISLIPLLQFSFSDWGDYSLPAAIFLAALITYFANITGTATAKRKPGNIIWSMSATAGFLAMNALMTMTTPVAPELTLNQHGLAEMRAKELIEIKEQEVKEKIKPSAEGLVKLNQVETECKRLENELKKYPRGSVQRNDFYINAYGEYSKVRSNYNWSAVPEGKRPVCANAKILNQEIRESAIQAQEIWARQKQKILLSASYVVGIRNTLPELYEQEFNEKGEVNSGIVKARLAIESTYTKLGQGEWTNLGFSIFCFALSILTSIFSCAMAISHSMRKDVQMSFDESLPIALEEFCQNDY